MKKPFIGIVSKNIDYSCEADVYHWSFQRISDSLRRVIYDCGGLAIAVLPQTLRENFNKKDESEITLLTEQEKADLIECLQLCSGVILQGGIASHNYEEFVAKYCYENNIPLIGICAGYNNIIRGLGGKAELISNPERHNREDLVYAHGCKIVDKDSLYYSIVKEENFEVNSLHTYIGTQIPSELSVVAVSDDGQTEVVEAKNKRFFVGIKYHPELLAKIDEKQKRIFERFVDECRK